MSKPHMYCNIQIYVCIRLYEVMENMKGHRNCWEGLHEVEVGVAHVNEG